MMLPSIKITKKASSTTAATATPRGILWFCNARTGGASMKLRMHASAMGSSTSRAKYNVATTITPISMALSVEDDELTAEPPTNDAVDRRALTFLRTASQYFQRQSAPFHGLVGKFAAIV